ncbi:MAG TPA: ABC transporter permease [Solirubrobacteraceae bacterium]|nr:ABC transporter permease [Solirubrobacteraceae bacterium]
MATEPAPVASTEGTGFEAVAEREHAVGVGPWKLAGRRLRRNKVALGFLVLFVLLVALALAAPIWAHDVAHTDPDANHLTESLREGKGSVNVVAFSGIPIGPQWFKAGGKFLLGADGNGRDIMVRLLYGARTSLEIGVSAALITTILAVIVALLAGYLGGIVDTILTRAMDIVWAFPVVILGVALGTALSIGGLSLGPITIQSGSLAIPILIIGCVYVPYIARPLRGQILSLREKEFIEAARAQGMGSVRIMFSEILPNLASTIVVFFPLSIANAILLEAYLSFLGAGVQAPTPSWGEMISEGINRITTAPHLTIVPGVMLILTVLSLNIFGDGVRDALDPRAKVRMEL